MFFDMCFDNNTKGIYLDYQIIKYLNFTEIKKVLNIQ